MLAIQFTEADPWTMINSIRGGAGLRVCGRKPELHDDRPYGVALSETYPLLRQLCQGEQSLPHQDECVRLHQDAADHGSMPMAIVSAISLKHFSRAMQKHLWSRLSLKQQNQIELLVGLAASDPDYRRVFQQPETRTIPLVRQ